MGQRAIEPLCLPVAVGQLPLRHFAGLRIENSRLLPTGMEIATYNLHRRLLLIQQLCSSIAKTYWIAEAFVRIPSILAQPGWI